MCSLSNEKLIIPFLATLGASLAIIVVQFIFRSLKETKQKIYTVGYISTASFQMLLSELILKRHTIQPHIDAVEKILDGDSELLNTMFESGEFDILRTGSMEYTHLPNEYTLLVGYDDIRLIQMYHTLLFLRKSEENRLALVSFVEGNLKSSHDFFINSEAKRNDILNTYRDYLYSLKHESDRVISFIRDTVHPSMKEYIGSRRFWLFRTKIPKEAVKKISAILEQYKRFLPPEDHARESIQGGIQNKL